jgi:hypothetical protein
MSACLFSFLLLPFVPRPNERAHAMQFPYRVRAKQQIGTVIAAPTVAGPMHFKFFESKGGGVFIGDKTHMVYRYQDSDYSTDKLVSMVKESSWFPNETEYYSYRTWPLPSDSATFGGSHFTTRSPKNRTPVGL